MELASYPALSVSWFAPGNVVSECACLVSQSCLTLCNHMGCSPPGSSVCGLSQTRILEWVAITLSRGSSWPRDQTCISCIGRWILYHWVTWEAPVSKQMRLYCEVAHLRAPQLAHGSQNSKNRRCWQWQSEHPTWWHWEWWPNFHHWGGRGLRRHL